jgi:hypothetical protein
MHALVLTGSPNNAKLLFAKSFAVTSFSFIEYDETHHNKSSRTIFYLSASSILVTYLYMPTLVEIVLYPNIFVED